MPNIKCPECSVETFIDNNNGHLDKTPDEFCRACDFPLYWAPVEIERRPVFAGSDAPQPAMRRLPGTEGLESATGIPCPNCREPNEHASETCWRCGEPMVAVIVVDTNVAAIIETEPDVPEVERFWDVPAWLLVTLGVILAILIVVALVTIFF